MKLVRKNATETGPNGFQSDCYERGRFPVVCSKFLRLNYLTRRHAPREAMSIGQDAGQTDLNCSESVFDILKQP
jgi:hypothetical protein